MMQKSYGSIFSFNFAGYAMQYTKLFLLQLSSAKFCAFPLFLCFLLQNNNIFLEAKFFLNVRNLQKEIEVSSIIPKKSARKTNVTRKRKNWFLGKNVALKIHQNPNRLGLGRQFGAFGVFSNDLSAPILVL